MTSLDPFLDQEYEEDDELEVSCGFGGLPGNSSQQQLVSSQAHQYSPSSSFGIAPNVYHDPANSFEVPATSFYSGAQPQPLSGGYALPQPTRYMDPMFDHSMQQPNGQQMYLHPVQPTVTRQQQQPQYQFQQDETMQQQQVQSASSDHSYASHSDAIRLYDDGSKDARNFSPSESRLLLDTPAKPMGRMVVEKCPAIERRVGETDSASAAAVRRISTEEGWTSMNGWLKAEGTETEKLLQLLGQCREAKVSVTLLRSNDTPKFIRKLSKNHKDEEVRALSLSIVTKWKKVVNPTDVVEEKKQRKKAEKKEGEEQEEEEHLEMKNQSMPVATRRSSNEGEKKKEPKRDREHRAKTKGRSTGLEGDDGTTNPAKKRGVNDTSPPNGAPPTKKGSTEKTPAASAGTLTTPSPKKPAAAKKITTSSSFMDSLLSPATSAAPKKKVLPKRPIQRSEVKVVRPTGAGGEDQGAHRGVIDMLLSPNADGKVVMEGLFADTSCSLKDDRVPSPPTKPTPAAAIFVAEEPDIAVGRRRIRFADENGGELVETRFFEIEEGERINVNRFTPEEMKHYEAVQENKWMRDNSGMNNEDDDDVDEATPNNPWLMPAHNPTSPLETSARKWRFVVADAADRTEVAYGSQSQMKEIQERRQQTAMKAFYLPNERCSHFDEPENQFDAEPEAVEADLRLEPVAIPTEPLFEEEEEIDGVAMEESQQPQQPTPIPSASLYDSPAEPESAQPVINGRLQALLNGLKTQGLLHDGSAEAAAAAESAASINPLSVPPPGLNVLPTVIPITSTYYQEQTTAQPMNGFQQQPGRMHQIQQEFPVQPQPPAFVPGGGAAASSSGIQVVNMDVHGPPPPMGGMGHPHVGPDAPFPPYHPVPGRHFFVSHKPCTFFNSPRSCKFGDKCGFAHVIDPSLHGGGGPPGPFSCGMRGAMRGGGGEFRGGPPRGAFRGRGFGGPPLVRGAMDHRDVPVPRGDVDMRRGDNWRDDKRDERRERRRSRSRSPSPSRRDRGRRDRDNRSRRREETKDIDFRTKVESRSVEVADTDGIPITSPVA